MSKKAANFLSKVVLSVAKKSSDSACDWMYFQPKVPKKLTKDK